MPDGVVVERHAWCVAAQQCTLQLELSAVPTHIWLIPSTLSWSNSHPGCCPLRLLCSIESMSASQMADSQTGFLVSHVCSGGLHEYNAHQQVWSPVLPSQHLHCPMWHSNLLTIEQQCIAAPCSVES